MHSAQLQCTGHSSNAQGIATMHRAQLRLEGDIFFREIRYYMYRTSSQPGPSHQPTQHNAQQALCTLCTLPDSSSSSSFAHPTCISSSPSWVDLEVFQTHQEEAEHQEFQERAEHLHRTIQASRRADAHTHTMYMYMSQVRQDNTQIQVPFLFYNTCFAREAFNGYCTLNFHSYSIRSMSARSQWFHALSE